MIPIITPHVMEEQERAWTIQDPLDRVAFAGRALFEKLISTLHPQEHLYFMIGKGLNGADGLCLAQHCLEAGFSLSVMCLFEKEELKQETLHFYQKLLAFDVIHPFKLPLLGRGVIIDALFGAGFKGEIPTHLIQTFNLINSSKFFKIALDIPSGIDGTTGAGTHFISCDLTLSIGFPKWGLFVKKGRLASGRITHIDLGLPYPQSQALGFLLTTDALYHYKPHEKPQSHKYERGQVLSFASHPSYQGANYLFTKAAYRAGAGLVRVFHNKESEFFSHLIPEVTQHTLSDLDLFLDKNHTACLLGPGLKPTSDQKALIRKILSKKIPCVIDAGAFDSTLTCHSQLVLTPHLEELKRLLNSTASSFDELLEQTQLLLHSGCTLVIKGHHTWILHQDQKPVIAASAPQATATAGSGDVLSGMIGCYLAKDMNPYEAALLSVGLHSHAANLATLTYSKQAILASDIIQALPEALNEL